MNNISADSRVTAVFKSDFVDTNRKMSLSLISGGGEFFYKSIINQIIPQTPRCIKEAAAEHSQIIIQVYNRFFSCKSIITVL